MPIMTYTKLSSNTNDEYPKHVFLKPLKIIYFSTFLTVGKSFWHVTFLNELFATFSMSMKSAESSF